MRRFLALVWTLGAGALLVSGCFVEPAYNGKKVACNSNADCKSLGSGYTCQPEGFCARPGDGGTVSDGGTGDGGMGDGGMGDGGQPTCTPACQSGETCNGTSCVPNADLLVTITSPADKAVVGDAPEVHATVTGAVGGVKKVTCATGGATVPATKNAQGDWVCTLDLSGTAQGASSTVTVTATDGKPRTAQAQVTLVHDTQPPTVSFQHPATDGAYVPQPESLQVSAKADDATLADLKLSYTDPGGTKTPLKDCTETPPSGTCATTIPLAAGQAPGTYTLVAIATDAGGHKARATRTFLIDGTPPTVTITSIPQGPVRRDTSAPITVAASDAQTSVAKVTLAVKAGAAGGAALPIPGVAGSTAGTTVFTVTGRSGTTATPVLDATTKTYTVVATATDVWGNAKQTTGQLTITRIAWQAALTAPAGGTGVALSPAVDSNGKVYVVWRGPANGDTIYAIDGATGTANKVGTTANRVLAGPMIAVDAGGLTHLYFLEERSTSPGIYDVESYQPGATKQDWVYPGPGLASGRSALGLPTLAGGTGLVYIPTNVPGVIGVTANRMCIDLVDMVAGSRSGSGCVTAQWSRARIATVTRTGSDLILAESHSGATAVLENASGWSTLTSGAVPGTAIGGPTVTLSRFYLVESPPSGTNPGKGMGFPWSTDLTTPAPAWSESLVGPSTGILKRGTDELAGGLQGRVWFGSAKDQTVFQSVALPVSGTVSSLSLGTGGRSYALVDTGTASQGAFVVALGPGPARAPLWQYPDPSSTTILPSPALGTTAVLGPNGFLFVPDGSGAVTALITDSATPGTGWTNSRGDPARTATVKGP